MMFVLGPWRLGLGRKRFNLDSIRSLSGLWPGTRTAPRSAWPLSARRPGKMPWSKQLEKGFAASKQPMAPTWPSVDHVCHAVPKPGEAPKRGRQGEVPSRRPKCMSLLIPGVAVVNGSSHWGMLAYVQPSQACAEVLRPWMPGPFGACLPAEAASLSCALLGTPRRDCRRWTLQFISRRWSICGGSHVNWFGF